jgi:hypothetical protein
MNIASSEGAIALANAQIVCQQPEVLTGFKFEESATSGSFRLNCMKLFVQLCVFNKNFDLRIKFPLDYFLHLSILLLANSFNSIIKMCNIPS